MKRMCFSRVESFKEEGGPYPVCVNDLADAPVEVDVLGRDLGLSQTFYIFLTLLAAFPVLISLPIFVCWVESSVDRRLGLSESSPMSLMSNERQESSAGAFLHL